MARSIQNKKKTKEKKNMESHMNIYTSTNRVATIKGIGSIVTYFSEEEPSSILLVVRTVEGKSASIQMDYDQMQKLARGYSKEQVYRNPVTKALMVLNRPSMSSENQDASITIIQPLNEQEMDASFITLDFTWDKKIEKLLEDTYYAMEVPVEEAPEEAIA
jgi:hypothetical protein